MSVWLQKSASIQPSTSLTKFANNGPNVRKKLEETQAILQRLAVLACLAAEESSRITDPMCAFYAQRTISAQRVLVQYLVLSERKPPSVAQTIRRSARRVP